jgi:hypothetical protein
MAHNIISIRHPSYIRDSLDWELWRDTFEGGEYYRDHYLVKFSNRETQTEFDERKLLTPIPTFAKSAILDVRNNIYQRLVGVSRVGGSKQYRDAVLGKDGGVDGEGSSMDAFVGKDVLTELLLMGKVGVYVDAAPPLGDTLADISYPPYLTYYRIEDILSYSMAPRGKGGEFQSVLLRDWNVTVEGQMGNGVILPNGTEVGYRLIWKDDNGVVWYKLFDKEGDIKMRPESIEDGAVRTNLKRVPFVLFDIGDSLMKDVASYQRSLLNLASNDVYYALKSNAPFLTIQRDHYASGDHLKRPEDAEGAQGHAEEVGGGKGRYYGIGEDRPGFISPPTDPLEASMKLQEKLEDNIRHLINLAVANKAGSRTESAESKKVSQGGLEAGLSFIGLELEAGEKLIAALWAEYENVSNPKPATVHYPERYTLKSDMERLEEAEQSLKLVERMPTQELKKVTAKMIVDTLVAGKLPQEQIDAIYRKIDSNSYILSDPQVTMQAHKAGLVDDLTASEALGYDAEKVVEQAKKDRAERLAATIIAQTPGGGSGVAGAGLTNPASRGVPEADTNPDSGSDEKAGDQNEVETPEPPQPGSGSENE